MNKNIILGLLQCFSKRFRSIYHHKNGPDTQTARPTFDEDATKRPFFYSQKDNS